MRITIFNYNRLCDPDKIGKSNLLNSLFPIGLLRRFTPSNDCCMFLLLFFLLLLTTGTNSFSQSARGLINEGVDLYQEQKFTDAEVNFKKGTELDPESFEAKFNLGDAYFKQQRYDEAVKTYQDAFASAKTDEQRAKVYYNIGNSLLKAQKVKESIGAYKESLKLNPNDPEAKYNLSYALNLLKNQQQQNQQQQNDNKDNKKDQKKDKNEQDKKQDEQKKDNQQQQPQNQQQKNEEAQQDNTKQQQQKEQKISKEEAQRILDALKDNEKELQKKLRKIKGRRVKTEKDW